MHLYVEVQQACCWPFLEGSPLRGLSSLLGNNSILRVTGSSLVLGMSVVELRDKPLGIHQSENGKMLWSRYQVANYQAKNQIYSNIH